MGFESWHAFYKSDLQGVYSLLVVPLVFLVFWLGRGRFRAREDETPNARFVRVYLLVFCVETLIDPIATGPMLRGLNAGEGLATATGLLFVLLGDFRVFWLVFAGCEPQRSLGSVTRQALAYTPIVAIAAFAGSRALGMAFAELPDQVLWLIHELLFVLMAISLIGVYVPRRATGLAPARVAALRRVVAYVIAYYGLWATCDVLILLGVEAGWGLRALPNQLYYAFWIPWVYFALGRDSD